MEAWILILVILAVGYPNSAKRVLLACTLFQVLDRR